MHRLHSLHSLVVMPCAFLLLGAGACRAQTRFTVSLNTAPLVGAAASPFSLDFQLNDGSGTGDHNNTAKLSNFNFGSGGAAGAATGSGGASGTLTSGVTLTDGSFVNELFQSFTPGNTLTFDVSLTGNPDAGLTPDEFSFGLLDKNLAGVPTAGASGAFLVADITPQGVSRQTFAGAGAYAAIAPPTVTPLAAAVPEPSSLALLSLGGLPLFALTRRRARAGRAA